METTDDSYDENVIRSLSMDLKLFDTTYDNTAIKRTKILDKLDAVIDTMEISFTEDTPREIEVKLATINAYRDTLTDIEKNATKRVELKMKKQETEDTANYSGLVAEFLLKCSVATPYIANDEVVDVESQALINGLQNVLDENNLVIPNTELRESPTDLTPE